jgi:predicted transcriptional regulator
MRTVCEIVVNDILPTLRAAVAKELITSYNLNQGEVAKLLDVSQPAISQYLRQLRGKPYFVDDKNVSSEIKELAGQLYNKQIEASALGTKMCAISKIVLDSGLLKDTAGYHKVDSCIACKPNN